MVVQGDKLLYETQKFSFHQGFGVSVSQNSRLHPVKYNPTTSWQVLTLGTSEAVPPSSPPPPEVFAPPCVYIQDENGIELSKGLVGL